MRTGIICFVCWYISSTNDSAMQCSINGRCEFKPTLWIANMVLNNFLGKYVFLKFDAFKIIILDICHLYIFQRLSFQLHTKKKKIGIKY